MARGPFSLGGLTVRELGRRVWTRMYSDAAWDTAAQLGFYCMLALFPLILFLVNLLTVLEALNVIDPLMLTLRRLMPPQAFALLRDELERITAGPRGDLLTFGALATIWASSSGVEALLNTLNRAYEVRETRSYYKVRGMAILMTFAIALMIIAGGVLLAFGDRFAQRGVAWLDIPWASTAVATVNYVLGLILMILGLEVVFYYGPNVANQKWRWVSPGSVVGVAMFILSSTGFSLYLRYTDSYSVMYGSIGAVIIMLFWLYMLGLAFITGGEVNAQIAAAARKHGIKDAPMVGLEAAPPKPGEPQPAQPPGADVARIDADPVRKLIAAARQEQGQARAALAAALGAYGPAAEAAVPDLAAMLEDEHPAVRAEAVAALARVGAPASSAVPKLRKLVEGEDPALREGAARAVAAIEEACDRPAAS